MRALLSAMMAILLAGCLPVLQAGGKAPAGQRVTVAATALSGAVLQVQIPSRGADAPLSLAAVNGDVETWMAVDDISLSFRRGVLVASRGLGFDLMGADAQTTLDAMAGRQGGVYRRQMRYLTGDHHSTWLMAGCTMKEAGPEVVGGRSLSRFEEACQARQHVFTNVFWRDGDGRIVRSRQWLSPEIGYVLTGLRE